MNGVKLIGNRVSLTLSDSAHLIQSKRRQNYPRGQDLQLIQICHTLHCAKAASN
jgi:hypothetical protein